MTACSDAILRGVLDGIADHLAGRETRPRMYALDPEALEAQVILSVEIRQEILRPRAAIAKPREVLDALAQFVSEVNGEPTSAPLFVVLRRGGMLAEHPRLLGDFARWVSREWPAEAVQ